MTERSGFAGGMKDKPGMLVGPEKDHIIAEVWQFDPNLDRYVAAPLLETRSGFLRQKYGLLTRQSSRF